MNRTAQQLVGLGGNADRGAVSMIFMKLTKYNDQT